MPAILAAAVTAILTSDTVAPLSPLREGPVKVPRPGITWTIPRSADSRSAGALLAERSDPALGTHVEHAVAG